MSPGANRPGTLPSIVSSTSTTGLCLCRLSACWQETPSLRSAESSGSCCLRYQKRFTWYSTSRLHPFLPSPNARSALGHPSPHVLPYLTKSHQPRHPPCHCCPSTIIITRACFRFYRERCYLQHLHHHQLSTSLKRHLRHLYVVELGPAALSPPLFQHRYYRPFPL